MSLLIADLGVFGSVLYTVTRKTKEIALRKVVGASTAAVQPILTREFVIQIEIANLIAFPLAYLMNSWSAEEEPFRPPFDLSVYVVGGILATVIAPATSAYHVVRASRANPTDALRHE